MPTTRSQGDHNNEPPRKVARRAVSEGTESDSHLTTLSSEDDANGIEKNIKDALQGVMTLRREVGTLRQKNTELQSEVDRLHESQDVSIQPKRGKRGGMSIQALVAQVKRLNDDVAKSEKAREKDKKKLRRLQMKEIEQDAAELKDEAVNGVDDTYEKMRKLLRRFFSLMITPSLDEKEECAVCMEEMTMVSARSLPCQHVFCVNCLPNFAKNECPTCRTSFDDMYDTESVQFTATQQWDALLDVATDWAQIDQHGDDDEPENTDEEEVPFIDDEDHDASSVASELAAFDRNEDNEAADETDDGKEPPGLSVSNDTRIHKEGLSTPPLEPGPSVHRPLEVKIPTTPTRLAASAQSYHHSPMSVKRKRLQDLADAKQRKRTR
ncbi:hypothetical protein DFH11DRAFT_1568994 [Phellopilus nigrolimitatus]|nr:hypothetical protein DFH11DRAFT_1568994 [Phellopilus nigrolimitatus]